MGEVHGDDPGLDPKPVHDQLASSVVGDRNAYIPVESLKRESTTLLVYGRRVDGPIGSLLRVAGESISVACQMYEAIHGPVAEGPAPNYHDEVPDLDIEVL